MENTSRFNDAGGCVQLVCMVNMYVNAGGVTCDDMPHVHHHVDHNVDRPSTCTYNKPHSTHAPMQTCTP